MSEHYDFHYQPTGSGAISGQQVLEQTEDAINELGDYVYDNVGGAMDVAQQALETAQNAETNAQTALDTANSFSDAIQSAQQDASTALSTAQTAQTTASNASNTANQASQDANTAVTTANNASGQVSTLSGTVTALGQRVTTAEGNIGQNTSDITALGQRVTTEEGNITTLQNDVSVAMGNASSAMATAGTVKQQAYVFRYSSTALVASSTNSNTLLDNTDNLKVGDKVIDSSGVLFSITAIDTANSTFTIGTALVDLAQDSDVVHKSGSETITGNKTFSSDVNVYNSDSSTDTANIVLKNSKAERGVESPEQSINFIDKNNNLLAKINCNIDNNNFTRLYITAYDSNNNSDGLFLRKTTSGTSIIPTTSSAIWLGNITAPFYNVQSNRFNGLTPSSLSLPSGNVSDFIDISSYFSNTGSGDTNTYTAPANGWIYLRLGNITSCQVALNNSSDRRLWGTSATGNVEQIIMPILKNTTLTTTWVTNSTVNVSTARFIPCQGNV